MKKPEEALAELARRLGEFRVALRNHLNKIPEGMRPYKDEEELDAMITDTILKQMKKLGMVPEIMHEFVDSLGGME